MVGRLSRRSPGPLCRSGLARSCWRAYARFWPRHSNSHRNEARAAAEGGFEEEHLSSIKRRNCCGNSIANSNVIHETKNRPIISLLISPYHTAARFGGGQAVSGPSWEFRAGCRQTTLATVRLYARQRTIFDVRCSDPYLQHGGNGLV
jgi:hypothetical protein